MSLSVERSLAQWSFSHMLFSLTRTTGEPDLLLCRDRDSNDPTRGVEYASEMKWQIHQAHIDETVKC